ncbi:LamG-like jellyroll fold domain-containing protein [Sorangium sp. So ce381]|uniref:LamG domain-containing protein n=1 Tax=Sorangium sp. So ce381 TaxID=3133307 RepID=UPI003F5B0FCC
MRNLSFGFAHPLSIKTSSAAVLALLASGAAACGSYGVDEGSLGDAELALEATVGASSAVSGVGTGVGGFGSSSVATSTTGVGVGVGGGGAGGSGSSVVASSSSVGVGGSGSSSTSSIAGVGGGDPATTTGVGVGGGDPGDPPPVGPPAVGFWQLDDCNAATTALFDSSGNGNTATRSANAACAQGISGLGVAFNKDNDKILVDDDAGFTFGQNLAVAAWVKPTAVSGSTPRTIVQEKGGGETSFSLDIRNSQARFTVTLTNGRTVTSRAPIQANVWTHVAGTFDGRFVRLFLNGEQVGQISAAGTLHDIDAPIRIGNNVQKERFTGVLDEVWLSASPTTAFEIAQLSCLRRPATLVVTPESSGVVAPNTPVPYQIAVTNNDVGSCTAGDYFLQISSPSAGIDVSADPQFFPGVLPGTTATFPVTVTGTEDAEPGAHEIPFSVVDFSSPQFFVASGALDFELTEPTGCFVRTSREIFVKHLSVVEDPLRTTFNGPPGDPRTGAWTFARLMEDMAPTPADAPAMVEELFSTWLTDQAVNGFTVPARPAIQQVVLDEWPRSPDGSLDLQQAPLLLLGIVNRIDVRNLAEGNAGEGRFVFGVVSQGFPQQFTVILEYKLPASTEADVLDWANDWHALGSLPFPSEAYNAALQDITTRFAGRNAAPGKPNGSSLGQLRTNEIALAGPWELREFVLSAQTGFLRPETVKLTPDLGFDGSPTLAAFVNQNEASIIAEQHTVPDTFQGSPFLGGSSFNNLTAWTAPGILNNEARHKFSLNTCNGCHGAAETGTGFLHVNPRSPGNEASLSGFMTGTTIPDPVTGEPRTLNDLRRRNQDLTALVCEPAPAFAALRAAPSGGASSSAAASRSAFIRRGIGRVH